MRILNFGSMNIDYVYSVDHIVKPGETISSTKLELFCGGKGLNQSIALARAGAQVCHAGLVGVDGEILLSALKRDGVNIQYVKTSDERSGNAIIQVDDKGQNSIVLFGGANQCNEKGFVDEVLSDFDTGDWLLLQNEVNLLDYMINKAFEKKMNIALNPSPFNEKILQCDLSKVSLFLLNEVEGAQITGESDSAEILCAMRKNDPHICVALTLGKHGVIYQDRENIYKHGIYDVPVVDTTAAGDTFTGYYLASIMQGMPQPEALKAASYASSLAVSKKGASASIPYRQEVETGMSLSSQVE